MPFDSTNFAPKLHAFYYLGESHGATYVAPEIESDLNSTAE